MMNWNENTDDILTCLNSLSIRDIDGREIGGGDYQLDGVRFHMGGYWEMLVTITTDDASIESNPCPPARRAAQIECRPEIADQHGIDLVSGQDYCVWPRRSAAQRSH